MFDEYHGQGGSYLLNPKTGKRQLVERTEPANAQPQPSNGSDPETPDPGKD